MTKGMQFERLSPEGWSTNGHGYGNFISAPPPAAAEVVVEQLEKAIMKSPHSMQLIIVRLLMTD
jgi:hypothetical protein